ncbi:MAG: TatD family hydrolase [Muribaculaceae bacterium]|nr:TatD family hydrolase [Muribaculaceae bacterium]
MIPEVSDLHTHNPLATDAVINLAPGMPMRPGALYSAGIHPWWAVADFDWVERMAAHPQVVMIGECGIDRLRGAHSPAEQLEMLRRHALLAERTGKPLLLHVVRGYGEIMALHRELRPTVPWIVHGFRGKPQLARQLTDMGIHLSLGPRFNPEVPSAVPPTMLHRETD